MSGIIRKDRNKIQYNSTARTKHQQGREWVTQPSGLFDFTNGELLYIVSLFAIIGGITIVVATLYLMRRSTPNPIQLEASNYFVTKIEE